MSGKQKDLTLRATLAIAQAKWGKRALAYTYEGGEDRYPGKSHVVGYFTRWGQYGTRDGGERWSAATYREACERAGLIQTEAAS
jgi:hypothetical protein